MTPGVPGRLSEYVIMCLRGSREDEDGLQYEERTVKD